MTDIMRIITNVVDCVANVVLINGDYTSSPGYSKGA